MKVACCWSGGKDSCLACWKAKAGGHDIGFLVNFVASGTGRDSFHGVPREILAMHSEASGIPMVQRETTWEQYERTFREVMGELREKGVEGLVAGDMAVEEHRQWTENMCGEFGFRPILPLWGIDPADVLDEFIAEGFEAVTVCVKGEFLGEEWLGRSIDGTFKADLQDPRRTPAVDVCGENGEFHTFVVDGPLFRNRISLVHGGKVWKDGYGFLQIAGASLAGKD
jgi:diphthine-ammonia ligase